jgi:putative phage-type endonuclease
MMSAVMKLVQGTPEWHAHRARYRNASETAAVMGASPWLTPYQLWLQRTGRVQQAVTAAMAHGTRLEPEARAAYEALTGTVMQPLVLVEGDYSASLDGMSFDGSLIVEIKCPYKGRQSSLWQAVEGGIVPEYYGWQVEHQLMVSGAAQAHLYVFDGSEGHLTKIAPRPERWQAIQEAWDGFMGCIETDTPPPLTDCDKVVRTDAEWRDAAEVYLDLKRESDRLAVLLDEAKAKLVGLAKHPSESGLGVTVTRFWKQGAVDYKRVPQLQGVDLEAYRAKLREEVRVSVAK